MGDNTLKVPMILFDENRKRLISKLRAEKNLPRGSVVLLQGGNSKNHYSTDVEYIFRQEPYFHWTFGVLEPGCYGAIVLKTGETMLFVPRVSEEYATWCGPVKTLCQIKKTYEVNRVTFADQVTEFLFFFHFFACKTLIHFLL